MNGKITKAAEQNNTALVLIHLFAPVSLGDSYATALTRSPECDPEAWGVVTTWTSTSSV
jgi:hypothetical protein